MNEKELLDVAFPKLSEAQMAAVEQHPLMEIRKMHAGDKLIAASDRNPNFLVVKTGEIEIVDVSGERPTTVKFHRHSEFAGDVAQVTGSPSIVNAIARTDGEAYELPAEALRDIVNGQPTSPARV